MKYSISAIDKAALYMYLHNIALPGLYKTKREKKEAIKNHQIPYYQADRKLVECDYISKEFGYLINDGRRLPVDYEIDLSGDTFDATGYILINGKTAADSAYHQAIAFTNNLIQKRIKHGEKILKEEIESFPCERIAGISIQNQIVNSKASRGAGYLLGLSELKCVDGGLIDIDGSGIYLTAYFVHTFGVYSLDHKYETKIRTGALTIGGKRQDSCLFKPGRTLACTSGFFHSEYKGDYTLKRFVELRDFFENNRFMVSFNPISTDETLKFTSTVEGRFLYIDELPNEVYYSFHIIDVNIEDKNSQIKYAETFEESEFSVGSPDNRIDKPSQFTMRMF